VFLRKKMSENADPTELRISYPVIYDFLDSLEINDENVLRVAPGKKVDLSRLNYILYE